MIIFADDTKFYKEKTSGDEIVGVGCLMLGEDSCTEIVSKALDILRANISKGNPRAEAMDLATISRGTFHASEDSYNAHSILTAEINKSLIGNFQYSYAPASNGGLEKAWKDCLQYLSIMTNQSPWPITVYLEQRSSGLKSEFEKIIDFTNHQIELGKYEQPAIPCFFPEVTVKVVDKSSAGIQVVDFILWANNRRFYSTPDHRAESQLKFTSKSKTGGLDSFIFQGDLVFQRGIRENLLGLYDNGCFPLPEFGDNQNIADLFLLVLNSVLTFLTETPDSRTKHLQTQRLPSLQPFYTHPLTTDGVQSFASCFIRIFDSKPLYDSTTPIQEMQKLLQAKKLCGLVLRKDLVNGVRTSQFLAKVFREQIKDSVNTSPKNDNLVPNSKKDEK